MVIFHLDELCKAVKEIGFNAIDLGRPERLAHTSKTWIYSSMCYTAGDNDLYKGLTIPSIMNTLIKEYLDVIPINGKGRYKNLICFSGSEKEWMMKPG